MAVLVGVIFVKVFVLRLGLVGGTWRSVVMFVGVVFVKVLVLELDVVGETWRRLAAKVALKGDKKKNAGYLKEILTKIGQEDLSVVLLRRQYKFCGHVARFADRDPSFFTSIVLKFRDEAFRSESLELHGRVGLEGRRSASLVRRIVDVRLDSKQEIH